jgi:Mor family transcriptional regulator
MSEHWTPLGMAVLDFRHRNGETLKELAEDYQLSPTRVRQVIDKYTRFMRIKTAYVKNLQSEVKDLMKDLR